MFQDWMRNRLGLGSPAPPSAPISGGPAIPKMGPSGGFVPPGFNPHPFHPVENPVGWQGHPMNKGFQETAGPMQPRGQYNPYAW